MKCDELKEVMNVMQVSGEHIPSGYYKKSEVDAAIAELKEFAEDACLERDDNQTAIDELQDETRRLKRALYKACANWALSTLAWLDCIDQGDPGKWSEMVQKCRAKAEEFK